MAIFINKAGLETLRVLHLQMSHLVQGRTWRSIGNLNQVLGASTASDQIYDSRAIVFMKFLITTVAVRRKWDMMP
jgi:hypothetical protein